MRHRIACFILIALAVSATLSAEDEMSEELRQTARQHIERDKWAGITLEPIAFKGRELTVRGISTNLNAIPNFVENVRWDPLFTIPELSYIRKCEDTSPVLYEFEFTCRVKEPPAAASRSSA